MSFSLFSSLWILAQTAEPAVEPVVVSSQISLTMTLLGGVLGILGSVLAGFWLQRFLAGKEIDSLLLPPWKLKVSPETLNRWRAAPLLGKAVILNGIVLTICLLLQSRGLSLVTLDQVLKLSGQLWLLLLTILIALGIARLVAAAVVSVFDNTTIRTQLELMFPHEVGKTTQPVAGLKRITHHETTADTSPEPATSPTPATAPATESFADSVARIVGLLVYLIVFLPVFMIAAEIWGWSATGTTLGEVWRWLLPFTGLTVTVLIGWFALTAFAISFCPPSQRRNVMVATSVLALILLTASFNTAFAIVCALSLLVLAWFTRNDLPDAFAGFYLQLQNNLTVKTMDGPGQVTLAELLICEVTTINGRYRIRNRYILRSYLDGQMIDESRMVKI